MHRIVRRLARRLERAVAALTRADATTEEWTADAVEALKRLVRAQQTALMVHDAAGTHVYGDARPANALRREASDPLAPPRTTRGFRETRRTPAAPDAAVAASTAASDGAFEVVGLIEPAGSRVLVGVCCTFDPPLGHAASATRLRLLRVVQPALASGVQARLARHAAEDVTGRATLVRRFRLTERECDVALQLQAGRTNLEIADALGISPCTARHHTERVLAKLGIRCRAAIHAALAEAGTAATLPALEAPGHLSARGAAERAVPLRAAEGPADRRNAAVPRGVSAAHAVYPPPRVASAAGRRPAGG